MNFSICLNKIPAFVDYGAIRFVTVNAAAKALIANNIMLAKKLLPSPFLLYDAVPNIPNPKNKTATKISTTKTFMYCPPNTSIPQIVDFVNPPVT